VNAEARAVVTFDARHVIGFHSTQILKKCVLPHSRMNRLNNASK
jgi:hypothetical protein